MGSFFAFLFLVFAFSFAFLCGGWAGGGCGLQFGYNFDGVTNFLRLSGRVHRPFHWTMDFDGAVKQARKRSCITLQIHPKGDQMSTATQLELQCTQNKAEHEA